MMRRPLRWRNRYTTAPTGHSMTPVTRKATNPSVGPMNLHRHGFSLVPHCTHAGNAMANLASSLPNPSSLFQVMVDECSGCW
uniref:Uncharacterized protein n=3 Tax=Aegilops tauschii subsp. strangulata TaxID=200361 RepID=A0A453JLI0_AEGTS